MPVCWDHAAALRRTEGDESLLRELIAVFFEQYPEQVGRLHWALAHADLVSLNAAAHSLKGSLSYLGAETAERLALQLEHASEAGDVANAAILVAQLRTAVDALRSATITGEPERHHGRCIQ